ncbi:MAG: MBL fold metallo-hydrolase, partial [Erysipelotrichaceae bacterium]|nr:MBL fold metallo-hydrolase [Erysipelotrichaceae bacterium]
DHYAESYRMRDNVWAIFSESLDGAGDPWIYVINGPQKAMVIDTGFGCGDLKGLVHKLVGEKELIVVNTHSHGDHSLGNAQFGRIYCHEDEVPCYKPGKPGKKLYDENGKGLYAEFDVNDLIEQKPYEVIGVESNHLFDLGDGYEVELIPLRGHTRGMSGYLDRHNHILFCGDLTSVLGSRGEKKDNNETCEQLRDDIAAIVARLDEIEGVFPGHGMLDQTPTMLVYELNTLNQILDDPQNYDDHVFIQRPGRVMESFRKNIHQGTAVRYMMDAVYKDK